MNIYSLGLNFNILQNLITQCYIGARIFYFFFIISISVYDTFKFMLKKAEQKVNKGSC